MMLQVAPISPRALLLCSIVRAYKDMLLSALESFGTKSLHRKFTTHFSLGADLDMPIGARVIDAPASEEEGTHGHLFWCYFVREGTIGHLAGATQKSCAHSYFLWVMNISTVGAFVAAAKPVEEDAIRLALQLPVAVDCPCPLNAPVNGTTQVVSRFSRRRLREHARLPLHVCPSPDIDATAPAGLCCPLPRP